YHVQVASSSAFGAAALVLDIDAGSTSISSPSLTPGKTYYWRVIANIPTGKSMYSNVWKVTYRANTALKIELVSLSGSIVTVKATLTNSDSNTPVPGKTLTFYQNTDGGPFASKGMATTAGIKSATPGVATKTWRTSVGNHTAYAIFKGDVAYSAVTTNPTDISYTRIQ
ncbi:MAG: hypothetical protein WA666_12255, partial [Nitrospirota bacterium]